MLNVTLVGGPSVEQMKGRFSSESFNLSKTFKFVGDLFESLDESYGEFLEVNTFVVLHYGLDSNEEIIKQIKDTQEIIDSLNTDAKLYFILKSKEDYEKCASIPGILVYAETHILLIEDITASDFEKVIGGVSDKQGLYVKKVEEVEIYDEHVDDELPEDIFKEDEPEEEEEKEEEIFERPKKKKPRRKAKPKREPEYEPEVSSGVEYKFKGLIAVTGNRGAGSTTIAANIAEIFAYNGNATMLIDLDYKKRNMALLYSEFKDGRNIKQATQIGILAALNNSDNLEDLGVVVKDNLVLLASGIEEDCFPTRFADRGEEELFNFSNILEMLSNAKSEYDVVIVDLPFDIIARSPELIMLVDKFVVPVENNVASVYNTFEGTFKSIREKSPATYKQLLTKMYVVINRYNERTKIGRKKFTPDLLLNEFLALENRNIKLAGLIHYDGIFATQYNEDKRAVDLSKDLYEEFNDIVDNILSL